MAFAVSQPLRAVPHQVSPVAIEITRQVSRLMGEINRLNTSTTIDSLAAPRATAPFPSEAGPGEVVDIRV